MSEAQQPAPPGASATAAQPPTAKTVKDVPAGVAIFSNLGSVFQSLVAKATSIWQTFEVGVLEPFVNTIVPEIEMDVESALRTFGEDLLGEVISLLNGGTTPNESTSQIVTSLVQKVDAQGKTIAIATAQTAAKQVTAAALQGSQQALAALKGAA